MDPDDGILEDLHYSGKGYEEKARKGVHERSR